MNTRRFVPACQDNEIPTVARYMVESETMCVFEWPEPDYGDYGIVVGADWYAEVVLSGDIWTKVGHDWWMGYDGIEDEDQGFVSVRVMMAIIITVTMAFLMSSDVWPMFFTGTVALLGGLGVMFVVHEVVHYTNMWLDRRINKFIAETREYVPFEGIAHITWEEGNK